MFFSMIYFLLILLVSKMSSDSETDQGPTPSKRNIPVYFDAPLVGVNKSLKFLLWNYCLNSVLKNRSTPSIWSTPLIEAPPDGGIEK